MQTAEATMVLTPLEEIEAEVHKHFGDNKPSEEQLQKFLPTLPRMDGGATALILVLIPILLQGYQIYMERERDRINAGGNCPRCGKPASSINRYSGRWECVNGHSWN